MAKQIDLLITDLDGTLYDWIGFYVPSFLALLRQLSQLSGVPEERLKQSFKRVNEFHRTSEYAFAIQELDVLPEARQGWSVEAILRKYDPAIHAFRSERRKTLRLFDGVRESLLRLKGAGIKLVAHSDSMMSYVSRRLRQLDIDEVFDAISAPKDHGLPTNTPASVRRAAKSQILSRVREVPFSPALRKPDPETLSPVLRAFGFPNGRTAYLGDSLSRDMLLASRCQLRGVWARYGSRPADLYEELLQITYWTPDEVSDEGRLLRELSVASPPTEIGSFAEILKICGVE